MTTILHIAGGRFVLADTEDGGRVDTRLARAIGATQTFDLSDGGRIAVRVTSHTPWVVEQTAR